MARPRKEIPEDILVLRQQGMSIPQIAKRWGIDRMTVMRRWLEKKDEIEAEEIWQDVQMERKFKVEMTLEYSHEAATRTDLTATLAINRAS